MSQGFTKDYPQPAQGSVNVFVNGVPVETTSGSEAAYTGLPDGINYIQLVCKDVSLSGTDYLLLQLGDSVTGGYLTSGYTGAGSRYGASVVTSVQTNGARIYLAANTESFTGVIHISRLDAATNHWVISTSGSSSDTTAISFTTGSEIVLAGSLDRLRLIPSGSDTFAEGKINIKYNNPDLVIAETVYLEGSIVQQVSTQDGELASGTTLLPLDDTIPQNTEGDEYMTCSITPESVSNLLKIEVVISLAHSSTTGQMTAALFQDSTADALAVMWQAKEAAANVPSSIAFTHWMTAGTTSSTTFKVRAGNNNAGTTYFNGQSGARRFAGVMASSITITEYKP